MPDSPQEGQHSAPEDKSKSRGSSRILVFVMLAIIVLGIVAFLVFHPDPSGAGHSTTHTTSSQ